MYREKLLKMRAIFYNWKTAEVGFSLKNKVKRSENTGLFPDIQLYQIFSVFFRKLATRKQILLLLFENLFFFYTQVLVVVGDRLLYNRSLKLVINRSKS